MSRSALHAKGVGASAGPKPAVSRTNKQKLGTAKATDSADIGNSVATKSAINAKSAKVHPALRSLATRRHAPVLEPGRPLSRLELLLAPRPPRPVYKPPEDSQLSKDVNKAIKLASLWTDVQKVVMAAPELSASNIGFALYRLGCLYSFASNFRRAEMRNSRLVEWLLAKAQKKLHQMDAGSITLVLDGCARLEVQPEAQLTALLANLVHTFAPAFDASQLPLVLWAFDRFHFIPRSSVLSALDSAADRLAAALSPQGIALTLHGFQAARFSPSPRTLNRLAEAMQRQLALFKPSEVAASLAAFSSFNYKPQMQLVLAVGQQCGQSVHSNIVSGKPALKRSPSEEASERAASLIENGSKVAVTHIAAAGRIFRSVSQRMGELEAAREAAPPQNGHLSHP